METRKAFVLWLSRDCITREGKVSLDGRLEDVDSGVDARFHSAEQLISFLEQRLNAQAGPQLTEEE